MIISNLELYVFKKSKYVKINNNDFSDVILINNKNYQNYHNEYKSIEVV